jgi:hypothetical protein
MGFRPRNLPDCNIVYQKCMLPRAPPPPDCDTVRFFFFWRRNQCALLEPVIDLQVHQNSPVASRRLVSTLCGL